MSESKLDLLIPEIHTPNCQIPFLRDLKLVPKQGLRTWHQDRRIRQLCGSISWRTGERLKTGQARPDRLPSLCSPPRLSPFPVAWLNFSRRPWRMTDDCVDLRRALRQRRIRYAMCFHYEILVYFSPLWALGLGFKSEVKLVFLGWGD